MDITNRRKFFLNCSTWVKCTICDGHIPQVLFLSKRGIHCNNQTFGMQNFDLAGNSGKI